MINVAILGASGSIGTQAIDVLRSHKDKFNLVSFSVGSNVEYAREIIEEFENVEFVSFKDEQTDFLNLETSFGEDGLIKCATHKNVDIVLVAVVGFIGLVPTIKAIEAGKDIALANKETLVCAGEIVMELVNKHDVNLYPVDSEHSAIYQCLHNQNRDELDKIIITASGGSFRDKSREELKNVTVSDALKHPNWSMGSKITIDSATMFNKGLEVIEAHHLFDIDYDDIEVLIHNESVIHSMVQFNDYSIIAQLGTTDMRLPIIYALSKTKRYYTDNFKQLDLSDITTLNFRKVDYKRFPALKMAYNAGRVGGTMPTVLNAAKEIAVDLFLDEKISFLDIEYIVFEELRNHEVILNPSIEQIVEVDRITRENVLGRRK